jgi:hypothetical protein
MNEVIQRIDSCVERYEGGEWQSVESLRDLLRDITTAYYHLTKYSIEAYRKHNGIMFLFDGSAARGKIKADEDVPELRMIRKIMEAADQVIWSIRSELSIIKKES